MPTQGIKVLRLSCLALLAGCQPPAAESYLERSQAHGARAQTGIVLASPDVAGAQWAEVTGEDRLVNPDKKTVHRIPVFGGDPPTDEPEHENRDDGHRQDQIGRAHV